MESAAEEPVSAVTAVAALRDLLMATERAQELDDVLLSVASAALPMLDASSVSISRFDGDRGEIRTLLNHGELGPSEQARPAAEVYRVSEHARMFDMAQAQRCWRMRADDPALQDSDRTLLADLEKPVALGVPIVTGHRVWGELFATRATLVPFDAADLEMAQTIGAALALGIDRLTGTQELRRLAYLDALTGLGNRRRADELLEDSINRRRNIVLVLLDVDGMKTLNDRSGHDTGDRLLRRLSALISEAAASLGSAVAVRLGGDEFALIAVDVEPDQVIKAAETLVERASVLDMDCGMSGGVAGSRDLNDPSVKALYRRADAAMYRAKRAGGGQIVVDARMGEQGQRPRPDTQITVASGAVGTQVVVGDPQARRILDALVGIAARVRHDLDGAAWWVSMAAAESDDLVTLACGVDRNPRAGLTGRLPVGTMYALEDFPRTVWATQGHVFVEHVHGDDPDAAELAFLTELGYTANLVAGATDPDGRRWLVEVFSDVLSAPPEDMTHRLLADVVDAMNTPEEDPAWSG
ncbi:MAG: diguanylate cyclase domain-containing protein [Nocardioidaceae bacterium]